MKTLIAAAIAGAVALALPLAAQAAPKKKLKRAKSVSERDIGAYGSATARQRANSRAYERGEYYEQMSDAHAFGSRSWWYLKEREMSNSRN